MTNNKTDQVGTSLVRDAERTEFAIKSAGIGVWEYLLDTNKVVWDDTCKELYGLAKDNEISYDQAIKYIHPDDLALIDNAVKLALKGHNGGKYDMRYRTIGADDGKLRWVHFKAQTYFNDKGEAIRFGGIAQDVTESMTQIILAQSEKEEAIRELKESQLFSQNVFFNSPVAKVVFEGSDMVVRMVNENMLEMLGRDSAIVGKPFMDAIPELRSTPIMERLTRVLNTGETFFQSEEKINLVKFGKPYTGYYNYIYKILTDTEGKKYGVMVTATEVTQQVIARHNTEESGAILQTAVDIAELGMWELDLATGIIEYSDRLKQWFGIRKDEVIDIERALKPILESDQKAVMAATTHAITPGTDGVYDVIYKTDISQTGKTRILRSRGMAHYDDRGKVSKLVGTVQDITLQREMQLTLEQEIQFRTEELDASNEELQAANEELAATNEELGELNDHLIQSNDDLQQFAHVTSHDLKEPARKIKTFIERVMDDKETTLSAKSQQYIMKADKAADRMFTMIDGVLTYSKLNASEQPIDKVDLNKVFNSIVVDLELIISQREAELTWTDLPEVEGAGILLYQLFYNLIINALKFGQKGRAPVVNISASNIKINNAPFSEIKIEDNGIGFDQRHAESIFNTFTRLNAKDAYEGTGLGLSLCKRIAQRHGGAIKAVGKPGEGAQFIILLPIIQIKEYI